jgi:hypothetical protein
MRRFAKTSPQIRSRNGENCTGRFKPDILLIEIRRDKLAACFSRELAVYTDAGD